MADITIDKLAPSWRADFRAGYLAMLPLWLGAAPFGIIYAISALAAGLSPAQTLAMSLLVFAGASQFTAVGMVAAGAGPLAITLTALVVNARHLLMAASLAPYVRGVGPRRRLLLAALLTDESYAVGMGRFLKGRGSAAFQAGCNLSLYTCWPLSTVAGILLGWAIPDPTAYGLDLVFPLTFIGLLVPLLRERANRPAAVIAALLTIVGALLLPGSWYVLLAGAGASGLAARGAKRKAQSMAPGAPEGDPTPGGTP
ncbi:MAG: AzlC family ABC transporter permease [Chloroflexales bacterium]|nr:AzlC family ABC transporter permease [Chloroflexales bacterium]